MKRIVSVSLAVLATVMLVAAPSAQAGSGYVPADDFYRDHSIDYSCSHDHVGRGLYTDYYYSIVHTYQGANPYITPVTSCYASRWLWGDWRTDYQGPAAHWIKCWDYGQSVGGDNIWVVMLGKDVRGVYIKFWYPDFYINEYTPYYVSQCGTV